MSDAVKDLIKRTAVRALEQKAYSLTMRMNAGRTIKIGDDPISVTDHQAVIDGLYEICEKLEGEL